MEVRTLFELRSNKKFYHFSLRSISFLSLKETLCDIIELEVKDDK